MLRFSYPFDYPLIHAQISLDAVAGKLELFHDRFTVLMQY